MTNLQYVSLSSTLDPGFWHVLSKNKLDEYGLSDEAVPLHGFYSNSNASGIPCLFHVDFTSFNEAPQSRTSGQFGMQGELVNTNTVDQFKTCDKKEMITNAGAKIWEAISNGDALRDPKLLNRFTILTFANLKKYHYHYWFAFPVFNPKIPVILTKEVVSAADYFSSKQLEQITQLYDTKLKPNSVPCFILRIASSDSDITLHHLTDESVRETSLSELVFVFTDASTLPQYPAWTLRNYLLLIAKYFVRQSDSRVRFMGLRDRTVKGQREIGHSIYFQVSLSPLTSKESFTVVGWEKNQQNKPLPRFVNMSKTMDPSQLAESAVDLNLKLMRWRLLPALDLESISQTKCLLLGAGTLGCNVARNLLGWGVRTITFVDNSIVSFSNPVRQSLFTFEDCQGGGKPKAQAAAESLKLIFPGVKASGVCMSIPMPGHPVPLSSVESVRKDVEALEQLIEHHDAVFLLMDTRESRWLPTVIGAAKNKIVMTAALGFDSWLAMRHGAYAVKPTTSDSPAGGAQAAGEDAVKPTSSDSPAGGAQAAGEDAVKPTSSDSPAGGAQAAGEDAVKPTSSDSPAGGAQAAGEDGSHKTFNKVIPGDDLGCYYCNDVVAPRDSTKDRTLDQQCTVSRPGLSMLCSALIVELLISLIQHPQRGKASAHLALDEDDDTEQCILGVLPHQIRGYLSRYQIILPVSRKFNKCTACSDIVVERYKSDGLEFLLDAFNDANYLEEITGLQELFADPLTAEVLSDFDADEDDW